MTTSITARGKVRGPLEIPAMRSKPMPMFENGNGVGHAYTPQLELCAFSLGAGKEWRPQVSGWNLVQVADGSGYWLQGHAKTELETGAVVLASSDVGGRILASCLNGMRLQFFSVIPERLTGLITQGEQDFFRRVAGQREFFRLLEPQNPIAQKMTEMCGSTARNGLLFRLILLQLLVETLGQELRDVHVERVQTDVKERLQQFLQETPPDALLEIDFTKLARILNCTPRHLSRVFDEVTGMSFREKRVEIRLARARELLATSQAKVVDVAFKSGFKSLSLFNRMFATRFGMSPGRWRQKNENGIVRKAAPNRPSVGRP